MSKKVIKIISPLEGEIDKIETDDILESLVDYFGVFPKNARIYKGDICKKNDITPHNKVDIADLSKQSDVSVVLYAQGGDDGGFNLFSIFGLFKKKKKTPKLALNSRFESPNNQLSERTNEARVNAQIPDIYGTVRSTPDLIMQTYTVYEKHKEVELSYMCIGRGLYDVWDIRDGDTPIENIEGASVEIYPPNTSPKSGTYQQIVGSEITQVLRTAIRINEINGQTLYAPNQNCIFGILTKVNDNTTTGNPNPGENGNFTLVHQTPNVWEGSFEVGQSVFLENAIYYPPTGSPINLNGGPYLISHIYQYGLVFDNPQAINGGFNNIETQYAPNHSTEYKNIDVKLDLVREVGSFFLDHTDIAQIIVNVTSENGLYKEGNGGKIRVDVTVEVYLLPVNSAGIADGSLEVYSGIIIGSSTTKSQRAKTIYITPATSKRYRITIKRVSDTDLGFDGNVVDEVKVVDCFIMKTINKSHFGNVTTVYSKTIATQRATAVKNRKLNMLVYRKLPILVNNEFSTTLYPTSHAGDIICAIAQDPYIGGMTLSSIDVNNIYDTIYDVHTYFGTALSGEFNYTFDSDNMSFEEMLTMICEAIHCVPYRQNNLIKISFEKKTDLSTLLFNHRNKIPQTEQRNIEFGNQSDYDGVELTFTDPADDAQIEFYIPYDKSAKNPKQIKAIGIRNKIQAYFLAWREYNKILHERFYVEFEALQEADLLVVRDRILVADNTRADVIDGEIVNKNGLILTLSQPMIFSPGKTYKIFLQMPSGFVESITITAGSNEYDVVLAIAPSEQLVYGADKYAKTTYLIVANDDAREKAFIVQEKTPQSSFTSKLKCVNYDNRYYDNDKDYENGVIDINGNVI